MVLKQRLFTPGPTPIPERILKAMQVPFLHHRTAEFTEYLQDASQRYQRLVESPTLPVFLTSSGTAAMEAALSQATAAGDKVVVVNGGKFGERWTEIANACGLSVIEICVEWGTTVSEEKFRETLSANPDCRAVCLQYCETSTAVLHPVRNLQKIIAEICPEALSIVDGITAVGTMPVSMKADGIDILLCGSQKALMLPPGLAMVTASERAWERIKKARNFRYYLDLETERKNQIKGVTAWTPAIPLVAGLKEVLCMLEEEGLENVYRRHSNMQLLCRETLLASGFTLTASDCAPPGVTAGFPPEGADSEKLRSYCQKSAGIQLAGGQDQYKGKIVRFGHMGYQDELDMVSVLYSVASALSEQGVEEKLIEQGLQKLSQIYLSINRHD